MPWRIPFVAVAIAASALVIGGAPEASAAQTWAVSNTNNSGAGSFAFALSQANDGDTISFDSNLTGTIFPSDGYELEHSITIDGPASDAVTISGAHIGAIIFTVDSGVTAAINHLTLTNSAAEFGAAAYVAEDTTLSLSHDTFSSDTADSSGGAIQTDGTVHSVDDTFSYDSTNGGAGTGGAIGGAGTVTSLGDTFDHDSADGYAGAIDVFEGSLTVTGDTFTNDSAPAGGAIDVDSGGTAKVVTTTFGDDTSTGNGGAISVDQDSTLTANSDLFDSDSADLSTGDGGAIYDAGDGVVSMMNDTLHGNAAANGGALYEDVPDGGAPQAAGIAAGSLTIADNTANAGSAIANAGGGSVSIEASIFESNANPCSGTVIDGGANIVDANGCGFGGAGAGVPDAQIGLQSLAGNGGDTKTMALAPESFALVFVPGAQCPSTDQRGDPRPTGSEGFCDAGAYELTAPLDSTVVTNTNASGPGSLAYVAANVQPGTTVTFGAGVTGTITLTSTIDLYRSVTIDGPGASSLTVSGGGNVVPISEPSGVTASISDLTIADGEGGDLTNAGTLMIDGLRITGATDGVGLLNAGTLTMSADTLTANNNDPSNYAFVGGGGLYVQSGVVTSSHDVFSNNTTCFGGGGIHVDDGTFAGTDDTISGNEVGQGCDTITEGGGGVATEDGTMSLVDSTVSGNWTVGGSESEPVDGGGIASNSALTLSGDTISGNATDGAGGGLGHDILGYGVNPPTGITNTTIADNSAGGDGGGVSGVVILGTNVTIAGNTSVAGPSQVVVYDGTSLTNSIVVGSAPACSDVLADGGGNVEDGTSCGFAGAGNNRTDAAIGLRPLANNGGPTLTMAIGAGSVADLLAPGGSCPLTDQRGVPRPHESGDKCDAGAFEYDPLPNRTLTITKAGTGSGSVLGSGISCGSNCSHPYSEGISVTLTAHPSVESRFAGWSGGGCSGSQPTCTVTMDNATRVTASFAELPPPTASVTGVKTGTGRFTVAFKGSGGSGAISFRCRLDSGSYKPCRSPVTFTKVKSGTHTFFVEAKDAHGRVEPHPTEKKIKVKS